MGFASFGLVSSVRHAAVAALGLSAVFASGGAWAGQVHALHGDGASYIDTGVTPGSTTRVVIRLAFDADFSGQNGLGGSGSKQTLRFGQANDSTSVRRLFACVNDSYNTCVYSTKAVDTDWHNLDLSAQGDLLFDGEKLGTGGLTKSCTGPMYLFAMNQQWSPANTACSYIKGSISTCKIYTGEKLVRDLVAWEKPDGTLCFKNLAYASSDAATGTEYYEKKGTGSFTAVCPDDVLVVSASDDIHGAATPDYGVYTGLTAGDARSLSSDASSVSLDGLIRGTCTGWKLYNAAGEVVNEGSGTSVNYTHPDPAAYRKLVWQWDAEYKVTATAGANGSVNSTTAWAKEGESATITATAAADDGYAFFRWTGEYGNADPAEPTITAQVPVGGSLVALFGRQIVVSHKDGDYDNLNAAVAAAANYDTILVKDGVYTNTTLGYLEIAKPIKVVSENGREKAFFRNNQDPISGKIYKDWVVRRGLKINHADAIVKGLTLYNFGCDGTPEGTDANPYGLGAYVKLGLIEYCTISNTLPNHGASALQMAGGEARWMRLSNNYGGGVSGSGAYLTGGKLVDSLICDNTGSRGLRLNNANAVALRCEIRNCPGGLQLDNGLAEACTITNNTGSSAGVYQKGGTLRRCLVACNKTGSTQKYGGVNSEGGAIEACDIYGNSSKFPVGIQLRKTAGSVSDTVVADGLTSIPSSDLVSIASGVTVANCTFQCPSVGGSKELNASAYFTSNDVCWIEADKVVGTKPLKVAFKAHCPGAASCIWDFGDGNESLQECPANTFAEAGDYTVTLSCGAQSAKLAVRVYPLKTYARVNGKNIKPYDTEENAATSIQAAIDAVYADDTVRGEVDLGNETWNYAGTDVASSLQGWIVVNRGVRLVGPETGEAKLDAKRKIQTLYMYHPRAVVERVTISNGSFSPYSGTMCGGSLYMLDGLVTNCIVSLGSSLMAGNATVYGGQVWNSTFCNGVSSTAGPDRYDGGLGLYGKALVANCLVYGNSGGRGGGMSLHHADAVVSNCVIRGNTSVGYGGAGAAVEKGLLTHCVVTNNAGPYGGGAYIYGSDAKVRNCLFAKNSSTGSGGGIYMAGGVIENCTVAYNTSASATRSDELYRSSGTIRNCIFCGKDTPSTKDVSGTGGTVTYSCFRADVGVTGTGVVCKDPKLKSPTTDDFTPMYGSPAIDSGTEITAVTTDLLGTARPVGDAYDMGCYEMDFSGQLTASFDADKTEGGGLTEVTLTANAVGGVQPYTYAWTIGDKTVTTDEAVYKVTLGYGSHTITLVVTDKNGTSTDPIVRENLVQIKAPVVYVSPDGTGDWPYDTWEKATDDWNAAVGAVYATAATPGKIWVADGTYTAHDTKPCTAPLTDPIELCGTNPACKAIFDGQGKEHRVVNVSNAKALVANLHFYNCKSGYGTADASKDPGAGALLLTDGVVSNCVFSGGTGTGAGLVAQRGGLLTDCVIRDHDAATHAGGDREGGGLHMAGGTAQRIVVSGCTDGSAGGVFMTGDSAVLRDSVIRNNISNSGGAIGLVKGTVENCIITNNTNYGGSEGFGVASGTGGAGVYQKGGTVRNCLIVNNRCSASGDRYGALYVTGSSTKSYNNTLWANTMGNKQTNDIALASGKVANTVAGVMTNMNGTAEGNYIGFAPGFKKSAKGDFRLKGSSPAVGIGVKSYWDGVTDPTDLVGNPRFSAHGLNAGCYQNPIRGMTLLVR